MDTVIGILFARPQAFVLGTKLNTVVCVYLRFTKCHRKSERWTPIGQKKNVLQSTNMSDITRLFAYCKGGAS